MRFEMPIEQYNRIFGPKDDLDDNGPGRSRKCKVCGGWHKLDKPWPHNCRPEAPQRADYPTPMVAPPFQPFKTGVLEGAEVITNRAEKRDFMARRDLVEYDAGVENQRTPEWVQHYDTERDVVADIKRFHETDPLNLPPDLKAERMNEGGSLEAGTEISTDGIEVIE